MKRTLIKNCGLLDDDAAAGFAPDACILVEDGRIAYAGPSGGFTVPEQADRTIDAGGALALPGFINAHTHVAMTVLRSAANDLPLHAWLNDRIWPLEAKMNGDMVYWGTMLGIAEMLAAGVTAFAEMYFFMDDIARAVEKSGIRAYLCRAVMGKADDGGRIDDATRVFKCWNHAANRRIRIGLAPHAEYTCSPEVLKKSAERAGELGCGLHLHISETLEEHEACKERHKKTPAGLFDELGLFDVPCLLAHGVYLEPEDMETIAQKKVTLAHCPGSNLILASGIAPVKRMLESGVTVALGTDGAASNNNLDVWQEMYLSAVMHKGVTRDATAVTAAQALKMATESGAKALNWDEEIGRLCSGARADLILVDIDKLQYWPKTDMKRHLVYSGGAQDVALTMVDGDVLYEKGTFPKMDIEQIRYHINKIQERLFGG